MMVGTMEERRGYRYHHAGPIYTGFNTILPPNQEYCVASDELSNGTHPASSRHQGGAHVLMSDGAVKFVTDSIEAGNRMSVTLYVDSGMVSSSSIDPQSVPGMQSAFGLWGALGTRASRETIDEDF